MNTDHKYHDLEYMKKILNRQGSMMRKIFDKARENNVLYGEDALFLFNTYAIVEPIILMICHSHGIGMDHEEFTRLLDEQKAETKKSRQC